MRLQRECFQGVSINESIFSLMAPERQQIVGSSPLHFLRKELSTCQSETTRVALPPCSFAHSVRNAASTCRRLKLATFLLRLVHFILTTVNRYRKSSRKSCNTAIT